MPLFRLDPHQLRFPSAHLAGPDGLLAIGGDFSPKRMLMAYAHGIFPWMRYANQPVWFSPDPRMVLVPEELHVPKSLAKVIRQHRFQLTMDLAFEEVVYACKDSLRPGQDGSWITRPYMKSLSELHQRGFAHSVEAWHNKKLVGGLYGIAIQKVFFGESMFALENDASKVAFAHFVQQLIDWDFRLIDCQQETDHLKRFGAKPWQRIEFLELLERETQGTLQNDFLLLDGKKEAPKWRFSRTYWDGRVQRKNAP